MKEICLSIITNDLQDWNYPYNNKYKVHERDDAIYIEFEHESAVSMFLLTWQPNRHTTGWKRITVVDNMDYEPKTFETYRQAMNDLEARLELLDDRIQRLNE